MSNMKDQMTFDEYVALLPSLPWFYRMTEDRARYESGRDTLDYYRNLAEENGPEWVDAYEAMQKSKRIH